MSQRLVGGCFNAHMAQGDVASTSAEEAPKQAQNTDDFENRHVIHRKVEIPVCVLEAKDCEARLATLHQTSPLTARCIEFKIPSGAAPGCILKVPLDDEEIEFVLPEYFQEGCTVCMRQREDLSWRIVRKCMVFSFVLPDCKPGEKVRYEVPDGNFLAMEVPEGLEPGELVTLKRCEGSGAWTFDRVDVLVDSDEVPNHPSWSSGPYPALLQVLRDRGMLTNLPVESGQLRVNVPFCGRFQEYPVLGTFLAEACLTLPGITGVSVLGMELFERYYDWAVAEKWFKNVYPNIDVKVREADLAEDPLPAAGLTIGIHPEVTKGGCWFRIIGSIVRSSAGGLCVFSTFYEVEMKTLLNMIDMYKADNASVEVIENPYYETHEPPAHSPMRYIIIVNCAR